MASSSYTFLVSDAEGRPIGHHTVTTLGAPISIEQALDLARRAPSIARDHRLVQLPDHAIGWKHVEREGRAAPAPWIELAPVREVERDDGAIVIAGDGRSELELAIRVRDVAEWSSRALEAGRERSPLRIADVPIAGWFRGELLVTTTRGRLSERGGRVRIDGGEGRIVLTSVAETVRAVDVEVTDPSGIALGSALRVRFD